MPFSNLSGIQVLPVGKASAVHGVIRVMVASKNLRNSSEKR